MAVMRLPTRDDVARTAKVSGATVSRVLNGRHDEYVSSETRERVLHAVRELGYHPNHMGRALVTGRTGLVALWMDQILTPFYSYVAHFFTTQASDYGYETTISLRNRRHPVTSGSDNPRASNWPVDGIIAHEDDRRVRAYLNQSKSRRTPIVSVGGVDFVIPEVDYVGIDLSNGATEAVQHLIRTGGRRVAMMIDGDFGHEGDERWEAYHSVMNEAGLQTELILTENQTRSEGRRAIVSYVQQYGCPDSIFCYNDDLAISAFRGLRDLGIRIPDDVALIGCDGIEDAEYHDPAITTVVQPLKKMCSLAWDCLERRLREPDCDLSQTILKPELVLRESTRS
jgi:DNA-binding LacI/PurR family transcriptional regulator